MEMARLDALQLALWDDAMAGDVKAAGMVLRIIEQRSRLLGLDRPGNESSAQTVVMSPSEMAEWKETQGGGMSLGGTEVVDPSGAAVCQVPQTGSRSWDLDAKPFRAAGVGRLQPADCHRCRRSPGCFS